MGGSSTTLSIVLKLVDDASSAMAGVADKLKSVGASMTNAGQTLTTVGKFWLTRMGLWKSPLFKAKPSATS